MLQATSDRTSTKPIEHQADAIVALINSKPRSPTRAEIIVTLAAVEGASRQELTAMHEDVPGTSSILELARQLGEIDRRSKADDFPRGQGDKLGQLFCEVEQRITEIEPKTAAEAAVWAVIVANSDGETWATRLSMWLMHRALQQAGVTLESLGLDTYLNYPIAPEFCSTPEPNEWRPSVIGLTADAMVASAGAAAADHAERSPI